MHSQKIVYRDNVYFGPNSVAKIILHYENPNKVDTFKDLLAVIYAFVLDCVIHPVVNWNEVLVLLSHYEAEDGSFYVAKTYNEKTIKGRIYVLHKLIEHVDAPKWLHALLDEIENALINKDFKKAYGLIYALAYQTNTLDLLEYVEQKINDVKAKPFIIMRNKT